MFLKNNFLLHLTAIFISVALMILPNNTFANEESEQHNQKGIEYHDSGKYTEAIKEYTMAINIENQSVYYNNRGWSYYYLPDYTNAEKDFKQAIKLNKDQKYSYRGLAYVYLRTGKNSEAEKYFIEAVKKYDDSDTKKIAIGDLTESLKLNDKNAEIYILRGQVYYKLQDYDKALDDFNKAIEILKNSKKSPEIDEHYAKLYEGRALVYKAQGKNDIAKEDFFEAGKKYYDNDKYTAAKEEFKKAIELDEKYAKAYYWLGMCEKTLNNRQDAIDNVTKAINFNYAEKEYAYYQRGYMKSQANDYSAAIKDFDKALEIKENFPAAYRERGNAYYKLKDSENLSSFTKYLYAWNAASDFKQYLELKEELKEKLDEKTKLNYQNKIEECKTPLDGLFDVLEIFGEVNTIFKVLLVALVLDYVLAIACGLRAGTLTSGVAAQNFFKVIIILLVVSVVNSLENVDTLKNWDVRDFAIAIILMYQLYSILENSERLGVPVPTWLKETLQTIREKIEGIFSRRP